MTCFKILIIYINFLHFRIIKCIFLIKIKKKWDKTVLLNSEACQYIYTIREIKEAILISLAI